jgi:GNAT superfamily N-acetyltransferase
LVFSSTAQPLSNGRFFLASTSAQNRSTQAFRASIIENQVSQMHINIVEEGGGLRRYDIHVEGKHIAYALVQEKSGHVFLESIKTEKAHRKQGVGSKLLDRVIEDYGDRAIETLARSFGDRTRALKGDQLVAFYERRGFKRFGQERDRGVYLRREAKLPPIDRSAADLPLLPNIEDTPC